MSDILTPLLLKRRSCRRFKSDAVEKEKTEKLLQAAQLAPSGKNTRPWEFIVIQDRQILQKLEGCRTPGQPFLPAAPLAIAVLADTAKTDTWIEDASIASILMQLQAEDLGLGSCWVQIRERSGANDKPADEYVRELLDIPLQMQVLSIIAIGKKDEIRKPFDEEKLQWEKIHIGKW